jgi:hypothetical protein
LRDKFEVQPFFWDSIFDFLAVHHVTLPHCLGQFQGDSFFLGKVFDELFFEKLIGVNPLKVRWGLFWL